MATSPLSDAPANSESEELRMRAAVTAWGRARWPGCRVLHELVLGRRRIDLLFVEERDLHGIEIKSGVDTLSRLKGQLEEYQRYIPEIWVAAAPKWIKDGHIPGVYGNLLSIDSTDTVRQHSPRAANIKDRPARDELVCSRLLDLLWYSEACAIAVRTDVIPIRVQKQMKRGHVLKMLSRLLTGNEIIAEVCACLRARPEGMVGHRSDAPMRTGANF